MPSGRLKRGANFGILEPLRVSLPQVSRGGGGGGGITTQSDDAKRLAKARLESAEAAATSAKAKAGTAEESAKADLKTKKATASLAEIKAREAMVVSKDNTLLRAAADEGPKRFAEQLMRIDPERAIDLRVKQVNLQNALLEGKSIRQKLSDQELQSYTSRLKTVGDIAARVEAAPAGSRAALYNEFLPQIRKIDPEAPETYNRGYTGAALSLAVPVNTAMNQRPSLTKFAFPEGAGREEIAEGIGKEETNKPITPIGKIRQAVKNGELSKEEGDILIKEELPELKTQAFQGLSPKVQGTLQQNLVDMAEQQSRLDQAVENFDSSFLTFAGQAGVKTVRFLEKASLDGVAKALGVDLGGAKETVAQYRKFTESVETVFNLFRKKITGAQASVQELDRLKGSILNKDLSPSEFKGSLERLQEALTSATDLYKSMLSEGIDLSSKEGLKEFDRRFTIRDRRSSAAEPTTDSPSSGFTPEQIEAELKRRGLQ